MEGGKSTASELVVVRRERGSKKEIGGSKVDGGDYEPLRSGFKCQREKTIAAREGVSEGRKLQDQ